MQLDAPKVWHSVDIIDVKNILNSDESVGLTVEEASKRFRAYGPNIVRLKKKMGPFKRFFLQFHNPLLYILIVSGAVTIVLKEYVDSSVILGVVIINAIMGFIQESKAEKAIQALKKLITTEAIVVRGGSKIQIPSADIVIGDVVILSSGMKVPADIRLYDIKDLQIDESALTGESVPAKKSAGVFSPETSLADRTNMAYAATLVTYGSGQGLVVATANDTETGKIAEFINQAVDIQTPLTKKIAKFSKLMLFVIMGLAAATFAVGVSRGFPLADIFMASIALAVGAIPEGLPAAVTIVLAIGVSRMAKKKAIIRKLPAVETLGSTTLICSDKTGTLTENQMTVKSIYAGGEVYDVTGEGYDPSGQIVIKSSKMGLENVSLIETLRCGILCNDSQLVKDDNKYIVKGDPTEAALIVSAKKSDLYNDGWLLNHERLDAIPFESDRQFMATLNSSEDGQNNIFIKGSLEKILELCSTAMQADGTRQSIEKDAIIKKAEEMAITGLRVLAFAKINTSLERILSKDLESDMVFIGLQGMIDPPRKEVVKAVAACRLAGISVKMITGDHALTAVTIAKQLGLSSDADPIVLIGADIEKLSDEELLRAVVSASVFARVAPEQKLRLVKAFQSSGNIVAMTGDGVNDAPALKQADIGVAMGITGTDVAKEAADIILTDDNFASIEAAVEEGRGVFDNLTKFIVWTLPTNMGEGLVILVSIFAGVALPILPVQILWINMTTAVILGLMLAFEPKEPQIMERPPRDPEKPILDIVLIGRIFIVSAILLAGAFGLFQWELVKGSTIQEARTVAVNVFVMVELFYLFNCRSLSKPFFPTGLMSNPWIIVGSLLMIALQMIYTYMPLMNKFFQSAPIGLTSWMAIVAVAVLAFTIITIEKYLRERFFTRK